MNALMRGTVAGFATLAIAGAPLAAQADWHGGGWHGGDWHGDWHGGGWNNGGAAVAGALLGLGIGAAVGGAYAPPTYYAPPPVYYAPPPAYYPPPGYYAPAYPPPPPPYGYP